ncbi:acyl carrier protein [Catellatospora paridis]|uniref:acyl carrier protein n=1 Tax=Catellatospora paridis TaxID=1617086 RepID=UPI0018AFEDFA|nr:acyl carrier protein [Catellatospora paridis]
MSDVIDQTIDGILKEVAELPESFQISGEQHLRSDLGIDSLSMIDLVMHVENKLDINIDEESVGSFATVADLQRHVRDLVATPVS